VLMLRHFGTAVNNHVSVLNGRNWPFFGMVERSNRHRNGESPWGPIADLTMLSAVSGSSTTSEEDEASSKSADSYPCDVSCMSARVWHRDWGLFFAVHALPKIELARVEAETGAVTVTWTGQDLS